MLAQRHAYGNMSWANLHILRALWRAVSPANFAWDPDKTANLGTNKLYTARVRKLKSENYLNLVFFKNRVAASHACLNLVRTGDGL
jgi:hypothetical protein